MEGSRFAVKVISPLEFDSMVKSSDRIRKTRTAGEKKFSTFPILLQDIFYILYQDYYFLYPAEVLLPGGKFNRLVLQQLLKTSEFKKARYYSTGNMPGSGMFTLYFAEKILRHLDNMIIETVNEIGMLEEELFYALTRLKAARKIAGIAEDGGFDPAAERFLFEADQWQSEADDKKRQLISLSTRLTQLWNTSGKRRMGIAEENSAEENSAEKNSAQENSEQRSSGEKLSFLTTGQADCGTGSGPGTGIWAKGDLKRRLKLAGEYLGSPSLERITKRLVQLTEASGDSRKSSEKDIMEIRGIQYGVDICLALPEELADFFTPARRLSFYRRLAEGSLFVYDNSSGKGKTKTPLVLCVDNSGSMQGAKEITSKALALALMEIASRQKRNITVIMFGGLSDPMKIFEFPGGRFALEQLTEIGECFLCSSGTDFEKPLMEAVKFFGRRKYHCGDLIFITDGVCNVSGPFLKTLESYKQERGFKITSVVVGYGNKPSSSLEAFSDRLFHSRELSAVDVAGELFEMLGGE